MSGLVTPKTTLPAAIKPMLARLTRRPFDSPDHIFELKWDGIRALAFVEAGRLRLQDRNLRDITSRFPELAQLPKLVKADHTVLDGELVCFDDRGHPSLSRLQQRLQRQSKSRAVRSPQVHFVAFDLLFLNGTSVTGEPLGLRKSILHEVLEPSELAQPCEFMETDGCAFFQATCDHGLEGIVAKDRSSRYLPGKRNSSWLKVKRVRECEFVVAGYTVGGKRTGQFSALLLGLYDEAKRLVFVGSVGVGFSKADRTQINAVLKGLHVQECPFDDPPKVQRLLYWCRPELVCGVEYGEFSDGGEVHYARYLSLREDKPPTDCRIVDAPGWPLSLAPLLG